MQEIQINRPDLLIYLLCISSSTLSICVFTGCTRTRIESERERERDKETNAPLAYIPNSTVVTTRKCKNTCFVVVCVGCHLIWARRKKGAKNKRHEKSTTKNAGKLQVGQTGRNDSKQSIKNQASERPQKGKVSEIKGANMKIRHRKKHKRIAPKLPPNNHQRTREKEQEKA